MKLPNYWTIKGYCLLMLFMCISYTSKAQLCTGSLGDPVVSLDFGAGTATFAGALGSGITTYSYVAQSFPYDGSYTVENTTAGAGNVWWSTTDHTGNTGGYMMVVNASTSVTDYFYQKSVSGLCPNTTYEFAAWVVNLLRSSDNNPPNITFSILSSDGSTVIQSYTTGSIARTSSGPVWRQFGFYFTTPAGTSDVIIKMSNSSPGGAPANDLALDDITFRPCGPSVSAVISSGGTSAEVCKGDATVFTLTGTVSSGYTSPAYQWQVSTDSGTTWTDIAGATSTTYTRLPTAPGTYLYRMAAAQTANIGSSACRVASNVITITVDDNPDPAASSNNPTCEGDTLQLSSSTGATYSWTGPNGFTSTSQNPVINGITSAGNGTYYVTLTTALGCSNTDSTVVDVNPAPVADAGSDVNICEGSTVTLQGSGGSTYLWSPASSLSDSSIASPVASPTDTTTYLLTVSNGQCKAYDEVSVFVWKKPTADAGPDQRIFEGDPAQLAGIAGGTDVTYSWTPVYNITDATILDPIVTPDSDTTYTLTVVSGDGCGTASDKVFIRVYKKIIIPNAFSPNNDGINDTWRIQKLDTYPDADLSVFNRYGQLVFKSRGYPNEWTGTYDGKPLPVGTYYYVIDLKTGFGKNPTGWVVILR
ncbi:gliding motility-associated C-terminal domain-containing protein [Chitinophaga sp. YR573]|uniref:gliding motility-associated C-terminal domain-containing protein n=1 Tax=Chitinophaga sp. YR573 TaxID=1881040 RepID=UPI0008D5554A|nr:gliding motility-associated C-terminal domain-containing protein [Chitinophaga sp. YR573]SEV96749.1 gliding motility-associated C-terminal domain-containing protein [Chitinophaga sp. YR573]